MKGQKFEKAENMRIPVGKILCLPYKLNSYLTDVKEVCKMRNSLLFRTKIVFYWKIAYIRQKLPCLRY